MLRQFSNNKTVSDGTGNERKLVSNPNDTSTELSETFPVTFLDVIFDIIKQTA